MSRKAMYRNRKQMKGCWVQGGTGLRAKEGRDPTAGRMMCRH